MRKKLISFSITYKKYVLSACETPSFSNHLCKNKKFYLFQSLIFKEKKIPLPPV